GAPQFSGKARNVAYLSILSARKPIQMNYPPGNVSSFARSCRRSNFSAKGPDFNICTLILTKVLSQQQHLALGATGPQITHDHYCANALQSVRFSQHVAANFSRLGNE